MRLSDFVAACLTAACLTAACLGATVLLATSVSAQEAPRPVKTVVLAPAQETLRRQFFGSVVARQTVDLAFQVAGQIREFPVLEGATVDEGALIARLDLEPFERALAQSEVQKRQADRDLERLQKLSSASVAQTTVDDAQSSADLAAIAVRDAEYALEHATLNAPFDGLVAARMVANYTTVQAGTPIVRLHDVSEWRVEIDVPEVLFRRAGQDPDLEIYGTFTGTDTRIPLEIREFNAEASEVGQSFTITLAMLEEPGPGILPGSTITVVADLMGGDSGIVLPPSAVVLDPAGDASVMLFAPDDDPGEEVTGTVRRVKVQLRAGPDGELRVEEGVAAGDEIVVAGAQALEDGQAVRRFAGFSN